MKNKTEFFMQIIGLSMMATLITGQIMFWIWRVEQKENYRSIETMRVQISQLQKQKQDTEQYLQHQIKVNKWLKEKERLGIR